MKVPAVALKVPPVPVVLVQTPPVASPVMRLNKSMIAVELSHTEVLPSVPADLKAEILTVATDASPTQGTVPVMV